MTEMGSAVMITDAIIVRLATIFPSTVMGYTSPYPTVISVTMHHQNARGIDANGSPLYASMTSMSPAMAAPFSLK